VHAWSAAAMLSVGEFLKSNMSQGSVATALRCGGICEFYCKFPADCISERILKIVQYLAQVWTTVWRLVFSESGVKIKVTNFMDHSARVRCRVHPEVVQIAVLIHYSRHCCQISLNFTVAVRQ